MTPREVGGLAAICAERLRAASEEARRRLGGGTAHRGGYPALVNSALSALASFALGLERVQGMEVGATLHFLEIESGLILDGLAAPERLAALADRVDAIGDSLRALAAE